MNRANSLAVSIKHFPENIGLSAREIEDMRRLSQEYNIVSDVADAYKHGKLRNSSRQVEVETHSCFEYENNSFRFMRNCISVVHASLGGHDFLDVTRGAILYLEDFFELNIDLKIEIKEGGTEFNYYALLYWENGLQPEINSINLQIFQRDAHGKLVNTDIEGIRFVVANLDQNANLSR